LLDTPAMTRLLLIAFVLQSGACARTDSENIRTSGIWATIVVDQERADRVEIDVNLRVGGITGTIIDLSGEDHVTVNGEEILGLHEDIAPSPDGRYDVTLVRADEQVTTSLVVPAPPTILETIPADEVRIADTLTIEWDVAEPGDQVQGSISGPCLASGQSFLDTEERGWFTSQRFTDAGPCTIDVDLVRATGFRLNPAYEGGSAEARNRAATAIEYVGTGL
jgi:hypothetical protein